MKLILIIFTLFSVSICKDKDNSLYLQKDWRNISNIHGLCYSPIVNPYYPTDVPWLYDEDLFHEGFRALWILTTFRFSKKGIDSDEKVVSRNDLQLISQSGFNLLHLYKFNPNRKSHIEFLDYCKQLDIKVLIPISNAVIGDWEYIEENVTKIIEEISIEKKIHDAVFGYIVSNEYDISNIDIEKVVNTIDLIARIDTDPSRPFIIPVSTAAGYRNVTLPAMGAWLEIYEELDPYIYNNRYIAATNFFMDGIGATNLLIEPYAEQFGRDSPPLLFTETGWSSGIGGDEAQSQIVHSEICTLLKYMYDENKRKFNIMGFNMFEYVQETWKGGEGSTEYLFGLNQQGSNISPNRPKTTPIWTPIGYSDSIEYDVLEIVSKEIWDDLANLNLNHDYKTNPICKSLPK